MLRPEYTYLFLDFETTGLDPQKDEPIQIACVLMDHTGQIIRTWSSFIRPTRPIKELAAIVTYLTKTSLDALQSAPQRTDIVSEVNSFLGDNIVLIGHNIGFDLTFLQKYIDRQPRFLLDTFPLTKTCLHFLPSYALEVIAQHLNISANNAHDALEDCLMNQQVFLHCMTHLQEVRHQYMIFDYVLEKSNAPLAAILQRTQKNYKFDHKELFLPPLTKPAPSARKLLNQEAALGVQQLEKDAYYIGDTNLSSLLSTIDRSDASRLLCFSHKSKLHIAEQILNSREVATCFLTDIPLFLPERINIFLQKKRFDEGETGFIAKYLSQHLQSHTIIDINSSDDYKIFHALTEPRPARQGQIILATHDQLYDSDTALDSHTRVLFFDKDRRRQSLQKKSTYRLDPLYILQHLDQAKYKADLLGDKQQEKEIEHILTSLQLFFGVLGGEVDNLFVNYPHPRMEIESLSTHTRLPKTKSMLHTIISTTFFTDTSRPISRRRDQQRLQIEELFEHICIIEKCMYQGNKWRYTFNKPQAFHTFDEIQEHFPPAIYTYFSTLQQSLPRLPISPKESSPYTFVDNITTPQQLIAHLESTPSGNIFLLTTSKSHGQDLFAQLVATQKNNERLIVGENITGGIGKVVYLATKATKPVLMIGSLGCYLAARAKKFAISRIIQYYCDDKQAPLLNADIRFYGA